MVKFVRITYNTDTVTWTFPKVPSSITCSSQALSIDCSTSRRRKVPSIWAQGPPGFSEF